MDIPISYLLDASAESLEDIEIKQRSAAAALAKEARALDAEAQRHLLTADCVSWLRANRFELLLARADRRAADARQLYLWKGIAPSRAEAQAGLAMLLDCMAEPAPAVAPTSALRRRSA